MQNVANILSKRRRPEKKKYSNRGRHALNLTTKSEGKGKTNAQRSAQRKDAMHKWKHFPSPPGSPLAKVKKERPGIGTLTTSLGFAITLLNVI
eukprot:5957373-Ditylum_brightwellii.AAC.1